MNNNIDLLIHDTVPVDLVVSGPIIITTVFYVSFVLMTFVYFGSQNQIMGQQETILKIPNDPEKVRLNQVVNEFCLIVMKVKKLD